MKVPIGWLREFADLPEGTAVVADRLAACGFAVDGIDDGVVDFDVTTNRPDALSVYGLAREASTAFDVPLKALALAPAPGGTAPVRVSIADTGCGRYALAIVDVQVGSSPDWLQARLASAGVRPINAIVDVTNYVMIETGQPMHAFDVNKLAGPELRVRRARPAEALTTLDGTGRTLDETMLVIADRDRAVAVAGVMGGASSEVSATTTRVALESAWFQPGTVRATSRQLGLKTEASARFERGADIEAPVVALRRAIALLQDLGAGTLVGGISDVYPRPAPRRVLSLRRARLAVVLGMTVPDADVQRVLGRLGFDPAPGEAGWRVSVPSFRVDITREIDLIEEVGRHWGLDRVPAHFPALTTVPRPSAPGVSRGRMLRRLLCGAGVQEAVTFTFIDAAAAGPFAAADDLVAIINPLSEKFAVLRPSLVAGLQESLTYNRNRQATDVRLFELGSIFSTRRGERAAIGWVLTGSRGAHWSGDSGAIAFTDTRGLAELVADAVGAELRFGPADDLPWLARGEGASVLVGDDRVGWVGRLAHSAADESPVYAGELEIDQLEPHAAATSRMTALPRFPAAVRDLSILVDERLPAAEVRGTIRSSAPATLVTVREFDRYQGKGVPAGQISLSIRLTFRHPDRTLTDAEVHQAVETIVEALVRAHNASLRGR